MIRRQVIFQTDKCWNFVEKLCYMHVFLRMYIKTINVHYQDLYVDKNVYMIKIKKN